MDKRIKSFIAVILLGILLFPGFGWVSYAAPSDFVVVVDADPQQAAPKPAAAPATPAPPPAAKPAGKPPGPEDTSASSSADEKLIDQNLLLSLKQANLNFSTIQFKELSNVKDKVLIVPVTQHSTKAYLTSVRQTIARSQPSNVIIVPIQDKPSKDIEVLLQQFGFDMQKAPMYTPNTRKLVFGGRIDDSVILPIGSLVYDIENQEGPLATWGLNMPAVVVSNKGTLLYNWNWHNPMPGTTFRGLINKWLTYKAGKNFSSVKRADALDDNPDIAVSFDNPTTYTIPPLPAPSSEPVPAVVRTSAQVNGAFVLTGNDPTLAHYQRLTTQLQGADKRYAQQVQVPESMTVTFERTQPTRVAYVPDNTPFPNRTSTKVVDGVNFQNVETAQAMPAVTPAATPTPTPNPSPTQAPQQFDPFAGLRTKTPMNMGKEGLDADMKQTQASQQSERESYPDEMYEFDESVRAERRSKDTQYAVAEFYNDRMRELSDMQDMVKRRGDHFLNQKPRYDAIQKALAKSSVAKSQFETYWFANDYGRALAAYEASRTYLMEALFDKVPISHVEGRAIWLDRGSIVATGSPENLRKLIKRIADAGFNVIFFESVNAGFPIYPSKLVKQNPLIKGWDPLAVAVDEAHHDGVELHAWVWTFAVGNKRHNPLIGMPEEYPGPILQDAGLMSEALKGSDGSLVPPGQNEYWLSPASPRARQFLTTLFSEIVTNYDVDGFQLDYIRYPFQKPNFKMGYEPVGLSRFQSQTGLALNSDGGYAYEAWTAWKAYQVTSFVKELSHTLKGIKPDLKLSVAVFPIAHNSRMVMIQQDWETWVRNGWIDMISPMAYSRSVRSLQRIVQYIHQVGEDKALVYPGLSLIKLNAIELLDALEVARDTGVMGTTLFAAAQFNPYKQLVLQVGPYKERDTLAPHRNPVMASSKLIHETEAVVDSLVVDGSGGNESAANLRELQTHLKTIGDSIDQLEKAQESTEHQDVGFLLGTVRDESRMLQSSAEQLKDYGSEGSVEDYQAQILKRMVDKVVRMVNYTTYQLSSAGNS